MKLYSDMERKGTENSPNTGNPASDTAAMNVGELRSRAAMPMHLRSKAGGGGRQVPCLCLLTQGRVSRSPDGGHWAEGKVGACEGAAVLLGRLGAFSFWTWVIVTQTFTWKYLI